jgi:hypothetical protein
MFLEAAVFVESDETTVRVSSVSARFVAFSCSSAARTSRARIAVEAAPFLTRSQPAMPQKLDC